MTLHAIAVIQTLQSDYDLDDDTILCIVADYLDEKCDVEDFANYACLQAEPDIEIPPQVISGIPEITSIYLPEPCEECVGSSTPGIFWDSRSDFVEEDIQKVERCDACEIYAGDRDAAIALANMLHTEAVFLEDRSWDVDREHRGRGYGCYGIRNPNKREVP